MGNRGVMPTEEALRTRADVRAIKNLLLQHGGTDISVPEEWLDHPPSWTAWMTPVLERGRLMDARVQREPMERNECHKNTTTLFVNQRVNSFATGFALHADNVWYFHSWGIRDDKGESIIVETHQETFQKYFGATYAGDDGQNSAHGLFTMVTS